MRDAFANLVAVILGAFLIGSVLAICAVWIIALLANPVTRWLLAAGVAGITIYALVREPCQTQRSSRSLFARLTS